jgi:hypothetical protein
MSEIYTEPELKELIAFYKKPLGKTLLRKHLEMMRRSEEMEQKWYIGLLPKMRTIAQEMSEIVRSQQPPKPSGK